MQIPRLPHAPKVSCPPRPPQQQIALQVPQIVVESLSVGMKEIRTAKLRARSSVEHSGDDCSNNDVLTVVGEPGIRHVVLQTSATLNRVASLAHIGKPIVQ